MTTAALAVVPDAPQELITWTPEQVSLIQRTVAKDCTQDEFKLFLYQCARTGLDPLAKQIYAVKRGGRMTIQTGIDGFRVTAERSKKLAGSDDAVFKGTPKTDDFEATVTVWKLVGGIRCPFTATARWSEYYPGAPQDAMWKKMPHTMLAKCAEALALRKAFPADLSGVYTKEEMEQAGEVIDAPRIAAPAATGADVDRYLEERENDPARGAQSNLPPDEPTDAEPAEGAKPGPEIPNDSTMVITLPQRRRLFGIAMTLFGEKKKAEAEIRAAVERVTGQTSTEALRQKQYERAVTILHVKAGVPEEKR